MHRIPFLRLVLSILFFFSTHSIFASDVSSPDYEAGEELYDLACANCHGKNMINPGTASFNLKEFPLDQKQRFMQSVTAGKGFMPALGELFDPEELEQLWIYVSQNR